MSIALTCLTIGTNLLKTKIQYLYVHIATHPLRMTKISRVDAIFQTFRTLCAQTASENFDNIVWHMCMMCATWVDAQQQFMKNSHNES